MTTKPHDKIEPGRYPCYPRGARYGAYINVTLEDDRYFFEFPFNKDLQVEIKQLDDRKYHGFDERNPRKVWSAKICPRNNFQLHRLMGQKVYELYDKPLDTQTFKRPLFEKQREMVNHGLTRRRCVIAGEMGTGKTLAAIEIMERSGGSDWWWIGPKSAIAAVTYDMKKWDCRIRPMFMTYEAMTKYVSNGNAVSPTGIVFDESSKLKTKNSKRTIAAMSAALTILHEDGYIILMSGTPAPKSPMDWWSQTEIACPGYLVESSPDTMKYTMAYITEESGPGDSKFPKLVGWKNTTLRCDVCGEFGSHMLHTCYEEPNAVKMAIIKDPSNVELRVKLQRIENTRMGLSGMHDFREGKNEVARLYKRLQGMSLTVFKKDCVDLPDKFYREIDCKPPRDLLQAAKALVGIEKKGAALRMKLRQLSDGFLYKEREIGRSKCMACEGKGSVDFWWSDQLDCAVPEGTDNAVFKQDQTCVHCGGDCTLPVMEPYTDPLPNSPKEEALGELFDEYEDIGRMVIFAAFTASIDKITALAVDKGWHYVRVDGRGWTNTLDTDDRAELLGLFQEVSKDSSPDKLVFIMHPESGGMGLTLTASPVAIFYSNDDKAENRFQAEDRIHRIGMDTAKGATIIDLFCLETDRLILSSLRNKKDLQSITLGDMTSCLENQIREV